MYKKTRKYKNKFMALGLMLSLLIALGACSSDDDDIKSGEDKDIPGNISVTIKPERAKLLRNPMTGWVIYAGLGDGLSETYWQDCDNLESTKGKVKVSDYATTLFIRGAWSDFNPEENRYAWDADLNTKPAQRFKILVEGAKERNLKLAFAFIVDSRDKSYNFTPDYVRNAPGIAGFESAVGTSTRVVWSPYPDNEVFQQKYEKFIRDFAAKYDDPDLVQYISGSGLGKWGEYHSMIYSTGNDNNREAVFDWVTDLYASAFKKTPIVMYYHRLLGSSKTGTNVDAGSEGLVNKAVDKGFSLRSDAFGMKTYYSDWERGIAAGNKFQCPIVMEGGWVKASHGGSIKGDGYETYADVRRGEYEEAKGAFVNMMDFRYNKDIRNGETSSWFNDAYYLVEEFIAEGGYRLYPARLSLPEKIENGSTIKIAHRWHNLGWGYCPTNLPQWKDRYKVAFALLDKNDLSVKHVFVDSNSEPSEWIKGSPKSYIYSTQVSNVASGDYVWAVGLIDTTKDKKIGIQISAKENITPDGWLKLLDVNIR